MKLNLRQLLPIFFISTSLVLTGCFEKKKEEDTSSSDSGGGSGGGGGGSSNPAAKIYVPYSHDTYGSTSVVVTNATNGEMVSLYSDANCSISVATATATSGTMAFFDVSGLASGSVNTFYAKSNSTACSAVPATYEVVTACPTGYIKIDGNSALGVKPFCVMKFEAKNVSGVPTSQPALVPWMDISANDAKADCKSLGSNYDLISSLEWQAIALDAQQVTSNWKNNIVGNANMNYGNSNMSAPPAAVADESNEWSGVTANGGANGPPTTNFDYRRTHHLSNGEVIWDLAGNANEIVDYGMASSYTSPPACNGSLAYGKPSQVGSNCPKIPADHYTPVNPAWGISAEETGSVRYFGVDNKVLFRGGRYDYTNKSGVGTFEMSNADLTDALAGQKIGFRCVYRLNPVAKSTVDYVKDHAEGPTVNFTGVQAGETLTMSTDAQCATTIGSSLAASATYSLTTNPVSTGTQTIYFSMTSLDGTKSTCQPQPISYSRIVCPTNFIPVPGNKTRNVNPFCVMKYEARYNNGNTTADPNDSYNYSVQETSAKDACLNMHYGFSDYNIIQNQEWMTIADNIYNVSSNWSGGAVGSGFLNHGVSAADDNEATAAISDLNNPYVGFTVSSAATTSFRYKRTHTLSNGNVIWDFAGNKAEIVDWGYGTQSNQFAQAPACTSGDGTAAAEFQTGASSCPALSASDYMPYSNTANSSKYVGQLFPSSTQGTLVRGGSYHDSVAGGIYAYRTVATNSVLGDLGVRCVYRP